MLMRKELFVIRNFTRLFSQNVRSTSSAAKYVKIHDQDQAKKSLSNMAPPIEPYVLKMQMESAQHMEVYDDLIRELCDFSEIAVVPHDLKEAQEHFKKALDYHLFDAKKKRMLITMETCKRMKGNDHLTPDFIRLSCLLGWSVEMMQVAHLIIDDIVDGSEIRRGKQCWHMLKDVGSIAVNDIMMFSNGAHLILKRYFGHLPCYLSMMNLLHEITMISYMGESLDVLLMKAGVAHFTMEKYRSASVCKTAYFVFYTQIAFPMLFCGYDLNADKQIFDAVKAIACELGLFLQARNDFLDCFADAAELQYKPPVDIKNGICTWLSAMAMELCNEQQKAIMLKYYGKNCPESIKQIEQLYIELKLPERFDRYEEDTYNAIKQQIYQLLSSSEHLQQILIETLNRTYNRT